jgi:hypothetical protein
MPIICSPRPYLKVTFLSVDPARHEHDFLMLDVDALDRSDALGEVEDLRLAERGQSCASRGPSPTQIGGD